MEPDWRAFFAATASTSSRSTGRTAPNGAGRVKSDPLDAVEAARSALNGRAKSVAKSKDGAVEAIRVLLVAKRSARQTRVKALTQVRHLVVTAPDELRSSMKGLTVPALVKEGAKLRSTRSSDPVSAATKAAISSLAHRIQALERELAELDEMINAHLTATAPELLALFGVGPDTAAALLVTRRRQPRAAPFRSCLRAPLWGVADPGVVWQELPVVFDSTAAAIVTRTARCGASSWWQRTIQRRRPTSSAARKKDEPSPR